MGKNTPQRKKFIMENLINEDEEAQREVAALNKTETKENES